jgi:hypothetical protein
LGAHMRRAAALVALAALALAVACAPAGSTAGHTADDGGGFAGGPDPGPSGVAAAMLARWADFPVGRRPRPIALIGQLVRESGYRTGDAKLAMATGRVALNARLPDGPATAPVSLPDGAYDLRAISAAQAFAVVAKLGDAKNAPGSSPAPLAITTVALGSAPGFPPTAASGRCRRGCSTARTCSNRSPSRRWTRPCSTARVTCPTSAPGRRGWPVTASRSP